MITKKANQQLVKFIHHEVVVCFFGTSCSLILRF